MESRAGCRVRAWGVLVSGVVALWALAQLLDVATNLTANLPVAVPKWLDWARPAIDPVIVHLAGPVPAWAFYGGLGSLMAISVFLALGMTVEPGWLSPAWRRLSRRREARPPAIDPDVPEHERPAPVGSDSTLTDDSGTAVSADEPLPTEAAGKSAPGTILGAEDRFRVLAERFSYVDAAAIKRVAKRGEIITLDDLDLIRPCLKNESLKPYMRVLIIETDVVQDRTWGKDGAPSSMKEGSEYDIAVPVGRDLVARGNARRVRMAPPNVTLKWAADAIPGDHLAVQVETDNDDETVGLKILSCDLERWRGGRWKGGGPHSAYKATINPPGLGVPASGWEGRWGDEMAHHNYRQVVTATGGGGFRLCSHDGRNLDLRREGLFRLTFEMQYRDQQMKSQRLCFSIAPPGPPKPAECPPASP